MALQIDSRLPLRPPVPSASPAVAVAPEDPRVSAARDATEVSAAVSATSSSPPMPSALAASLTIASAMTASPVAIHLTDADCRQALHHAAEHGAEFHEVRGFRIPVLMERTRVVDADRAAALLADGQAEALSVRLPRTVLLPVPTPAAAIALDVFSSGGDIRTLERPALASLLLDIEADGCALRDGRELIGAFGAYTRLSSARGEACVWRDDVPLVPLAVDMAAHPVEVRDAVRRSREALTSLQSRGDAETASDMALLVQPCGDASFADRAAFLEKIQAQRGDRSTARLDYQLVTRSRRDGERLSDVAGFFLALRDNNPNADLRDLHGAFNFCRSRLWGDAARLDSFQRFYGETHDINATVRAMDLLATPVRGESYADRERFLIDDARAAEAVLPYGSRALSGEQALDDFAYIRDDLRPGETFAAVAADYLAVMQGVHETGKDFAQVRPAFRYMRDRLAGDPARTTDFRDIVRHLGTADASIKALAFIDDRTSAIPRTARRDVLIGLLAATHDLPEAERRFDQIERGLQPTEDFATLGRVYADLLGDLKEEYLRQDVGQAFDYVRANLAGDPAAIDRFRQVVRAGRSFRDAAAIYPTLRQAVRAEDERTRVAQYLRVVTLAGKRGRPLELFGKVTAHLLAGESLKDGVDQLEAMRTALSVDRDQTDLATAYGDLKQRMQSQPDEMKIVGRLLQKLESYKAASVARQALDQSVAGESFEARESLLDQLVDEEKKRGQAAAQGGLDYAAVVSGRIGHESLPDSSARFIALLSALRGKDASRQARETFQWMADGFKNGSFSQKSPDEVTAMLVESLLLNGDMAAARSRAACGEKQTGTVEKQDDYVIIGGIRVPVQRHG